MTTHQHARPARICDDADLNDRFCYWQGASGQTYIHSVYPAKACPPLPGTIYIAVRRDAAGERHAVGTGHFDEFHPYSNGPQGRSRHDELHVHMLARSRSEAVDILQDLQTALFGAAHSHHQAQERSTPLTPAGLDEPLADLFAFDQPQASTGGGNLVSTSTA